jgi:tetratricopeptide (TPR) repeat protein
MTGGQPRDEWPAELRLDDEAGPAPYITRGKVDALVLGALDQAGFVGPQAIGPRGAGRSPMPHKPGLGFRSLAAAVVLACLTVGSASAAVMWYARKHAEKQTEARASAAEDATRAARSPARQVEVSPILAPAEPAPVQRTEAVVGKEAPRAPEDWLVEGNRLRSEKRWSKADEAYTRAAQRAPHSQTAYVARVASAAVRLEHLHDPRGALSRYRAALQQAPHGALSEEIHLGVADAERALGNRDGERAALELFLREHPSSPLAAQAKARLE